MKLTKAALSFTLLTLSAASAVELMEPSSSVQTSMEHHDPFVSFLESKKPTNTLVPKLLKLREEFKVWVSEFGRAYETMEEELTRMMVWVENHGMYMQQTSTIIFIIICIVVIINIS